MNINDRIKALEQEIKIERAEVARICQMSLQQNKRLGENMDLVSRSQDLERMINDLQRLKEDSSSLN